MFKGFTRRGWAFLLLFLQQLLQREPPLGLMQLEAVSLAGRLQFGLPHRVDHRTLPLIPWR